MQAQNDYSTEPSRVLSDEMRTAWRPTRVALLESQRPVPDQFSAVVRVAIEGRRELHGHGIAVVDLTVTIARRAGELHRALDASIAEADTGQTEDFAAVIAALRPRP